MSKKITWKMLYDEFRKNHPELGKKTVYHRPYDFMTILIYVDDGTMGIYDGLKHHFEFIDKKWKGET